MKINKTQSAKKNCFFFSPFPCSSSFQSELCYKTYDLHLSRCVKWVFTAWLEGTCSETCGDRRWSLTRCDHLRWHGGLKVCLRAAQLSAALLKTCSVSCGVSWPDEAGGAGAAGPSILQSVQSGWNACSGGSDYRAIDASWEQARSGEFLLEETWYSPN